MKRFVFWLRDFFLEYVLLIVIVGGVLGGIVWILARVFLWDTSTLSLSVDPDVSVATLEIQARMIYRDATIFGTYYPFHVVFPWSETVDCSDGQCVFEGVPHGDGSLTVSGEETRRSALFVAPDTRGVLDLRRPIRLRMVRDARELTEIIPPRELSFPADATVINRLQGLAITGTGDRAGLYDAVRGQTFQLPRSDIASVFRGSAEGAYYFLTQEGEVIAYDRYTGASSRSEEDTTGPVFLSWSPGQTTLKKNETYLQLEGAFFWLQEGGHEWITDGKEIYDILLSE